MFSQTVEYALSAMVQLASDAPAASTTKEIADKTKVPGAYLAKVLQSMRRAGLLNSRRGVGGGVSLSRPPKRISLLEVIDAVEPLQRGSTAVRRKTQLAPLGRKLDEALAQVRKTLGGASLADVMPASRKTAAARSTAKQRSARRAK